MTLTKEEKELVIKVLEIGHANGNTINPRPFVPENGKEYRAITKIIRKLKFGA